MPETKSIPPQHIKEFLDDWLGIVSELIPWADDPACYTELKYKSPKGILLFVISLQWYRGAWRFNNRSQALPVDVDQLKVLIENPPPQQLKEALFQGD